MGTTSLVRYADRMRRRRGVHNRCGLRKSKAKLESLRRDDPASTIRPKAPELGDQHEIEDGSQFRLGIGDVSGPGGEGNAPVFREQEVVFLVARSTKPEVFYLNLRTDALRGANDTAIA